MSSRRKISLLLYKRVDHQVQQLLDLGLEAERFFGDVADIVAWSRGECSCETRSCEIPP